MATPAFIALASALVEAMGQKLDAAKPIPEGLALRTGDGFLYAFFEDPDQVSFDSVRRLFADGDELPPHLVVLTPGRLPLAIAAEVTRRGGSLVEGSQFHELAHQLGLGPLLGEEPRPADSTLRRLLPSAQQLDGIMSRARTWLGWGVPALALRFYRQAASLKPEFLPAKTGVGRALLGLGLVADAERTFEEVLAIRPDDVDARLGKAATLGARSRPHDEIEVYRALLAEDQARLEVRAHLVAALVDLGDWVGARVEIEALLSGTPEDAQLRFLHGVALERTGEPAEGVRERAEARSLGLSYEREAALCQHLGLPAPLKTAGGLEGPAPRPPPRKGAPVVAPSRPAVAHPKPPPHAPPTKRSRARARAASPRKRK